MTTVDDAPERVAWLKWIDRFSILLAVVGGVVTILMMLNIVADVIGRYFYNRPLPGTLDLTQFAYMPALVALALGYATLQAEHIRVNLLTAATGERTQRIVEIFAMAFSFVTVILFIWFGIEKAEQAMGFGERAVGTPWLMIWPFRWVLVIGLIGLLLQTFAVLVRAITVKNFIPDDADEDISALEEEGSVFDDLDLDSKSINLLDRGEAAKS